MNTATDHPPPAPAAAPPPADPAAAAYFAGTRGKLSLWAGVLGGPVAWSLNLLAGYALSRFSYGRPWLTGVHHAVTAAMLLATVGALALAWRDWRRIGRGQPEAAEGGVAGRSRFLAALGILTSALFAFVILGQWVPVFLIDPRHY